MPIKYHKISVTIIFIDIAAIETYAHTICLYVDMALKNTLVFHLRYKVSENRGGNFIMYEILLMVQR